MQDSVANIERQIEYYQRKYELNPHSRAFAPLADLYRKAGRFEEALELLGVGLTEHPQYISALVILGRCQLEAGRAAEAGEAFRRVLALDPDNLVALKQLAESALAEGELEQGRAWLERVVFLDPTDEAAILRLEALRGAPEPSPGATTAAPAEPAPTEAVRAATEPAARALGEEEPEAVAPAAVEATVQERQSFATRTLAEIYLSQGYRDKALVVLRQILARHPERTDIADKVAEIESQLGGAEAAPPPPPETPAIAGPAAPRPSESRRHFEDWLDRLGKPEGRA